jgi:hypothetical protein
LRKFVQLSNAAGDGSDRPVEAISAIAPREDPHG